MKTLGIEIILPTLLAISLGLAIKKHRGGICTAQTNAVPPVIAFELSDIKLAGRHLAAGRAGGPSGYPGSLLTREVAILLSQLGVQFGACAGDPSQEIGAEQSGVPFPHRAGPLLAGIEPPGLLLLLLLIEIEVEEIGPVEEG